MTIFKQLPNTSRPSLQVSHDCDCIKSRYNDAEANVLLRYVLNVLLKIFQVTGKIIQLGFELLAVYPNEVLLTRYLRHLSSPSLCTNEGTDKMNRRTFAIAYERGTLHRILHTADVVEVYA